MEINQQLIVIILVILLLAPAYVLLLAMFSHIGKIWAIKALVGKEQKVPPLLQTIKKEDAIPQWQKREKENLKEQ